MNNRNYEKLERASQTKKRVTSTITYILLVIWALVVLFPFYWMILTSVKSYSAYNGEYIPTFFTLSPTFQNYVDAFTTVSLGRYFLNTLIFTVATTAIMLVVVTLAAFAFARLDFPGKNLAFTLFLSLMMIPNELVIITNFVTITDLDLRNTFMGLILPSVTSVFYIYLLRENFAQIPDELYNAAKVDGTTDFKYLTRVMMPMEISLSYHFLLMRLTTLSPFNAFELCSKPLYSGHLFTIRSLGKEPYPTCSRIHRLDLEAMMELLFESVLVGHVEEVFIVAIGWNPSGLDVGHRKVLLNKVQKCIEVLSHPAAKTREDAVDLPLSRIGELQKRVEAVASSRLNGHSHSSFPFPIVCGLPQCRRLYRA